jgi:transposase
MRTSDKAERPRKKIADTTEAALEHFLAPALHRGDIVVMDNLASHKVAGVKEAIEQAGAMLRYLPAYSPDLNPIEQVLIQSNKFSPSSR